MARRQEGWLPSPPPGSCSFPRPSSCSGARSGTFSGDLVSSRDVDPGLHPPIPILRMFDVEATKRFYVEYLGFGLDRQDGEGDRPIFMRISRGPVALNLSSFPGDGTPGSVVLVVVDDLDQLHAELHSKDYPFMNPGIELRGIGREMMVLDPASNQIRFFEPGR